MKLRNSRPFAFKHSTRPHSRAFRQTVGSHRQLGPAAEAWHQQEAVSQHYASGDIIQDASEAIADIRDDAALQTYLNAANPSAGLGHAILSPFAAAGEFPGGAAAADRASASVAGEVAHGAELRATALPFGTAITGGGAVGPEELHSHLAGFAVIGQGTKVLGADATIDGALIGVGLALVTDNKIAILGPAVTGDDGISRQLARFSSRVLPALDLNLAGMSDHLGVGLRVLAACGRASVYEKFVPVAELAQMMRRRDHWYRNIVESLAAVGVRAGISVPSARGLAADMGSVDKLAPGEGVTWQTTRSLLFGLAAGSYGLRASGTVTLRGQSFMRLERLPDGLVRLTVRPTQVASLRMGAELRLVAEVAGEVTRLVAQQHSFTFDISQPGPRRALAAALRGELPPLTGPTGDAGVAHLASHALRHQESALAVNAFRLPAIVGGSSLGASRTRSTSTLTSRSGAGDVSVTETRSSASSLSLLSLGSLSQTSSASLLSSLTTTSGGSEMTARQVHLTLSGEVEGGGHLLRQRLVARLRPTLGGAAPADRIQTTRRYAIEATQRLHIGSFQTIAELPDAQLQQLADAHPLPHRELVAVRALAARAIAGGLHGDYARAIAALARRGSSGIQAMQLLAGQGSVQLEVSNAAHDQMLIDFLKAETYALGAKTHRHARAVMRRLEKLDRRIAAARADVGRDWVMARMGAAELGRRERFLGILADEVLHLAADVSEDLYP